jgi:hypothetical protein
MNGITTMTKLTDTQLVVLTAALAREDGSILPLPDHLKGGAVGKVCAALLTKGLAEEVALAPDRARAAPETIFRMTEDGPSVLRLTTSAQTLLGGEAAPGEETEADAGAPNAPAAAEPVQSGEPASARQPRPGTKLDRLIALLRRPEGVSTAEASEALAWMQHSVRGAIAGNLKKKYGLAIRGQKVEGRGMVYHTAP